ncbi:hypothetical protein L227DRAFT_365955 [Lentinus tigrinus ALCF2SS1-6]|uniref:Uncharacterized protein n=1 Tax=Lentinus tigrinus ALCF2SS1-6 TaxID=1328759 RepID=A0A5C2SKW8_9APHY|nr:hypothetical protein L227DRAFT_365955 [Lentinus tigrinus ALCF2SS1-6]
MYVRDGIYSERTSSWFSNSVSFVAPAASFNAIIVGRSFGMGVLFRYSLQHVNDAASLLVREE